MYVVTHYGFNAPYFLVPQMIIGFRWRRKKFGEVIWGFFSLLHSRIGIAAHMHVIITSLNEDWLKLIRFLHQRGKGMRLNFSHHYKDLDQIEQKTPIFFIKMQKNDYKIDFLPATTEIWFDNFFFQLYFKINNRNCVLDLIIYNLNCFAGNFTRWGILPNHETTDGQS